MSTNKNLTRRARQITAAAHTVKLSTQIARRHLECEQLIARYQAFGLEPQHTPGLRGMLGGLRACPTRGRSPVRSRGGWWGRWWLRWRRRGEHRGHSAGATARPSH